MDNLLEIIVPIIFAAIYFFGSMFNKKSDEDVPGSAPRQREKDPEAAERQRRIQEEIRRKIMERRGQSEGSPGSPSRPDPSLARRTEETPSRDRQTSVWPRPHASTPPESDSPRRRLDERQPSRDRGSPHPHMSDSQEPTREPAAPFSWDTSDAYSNQMQERLKQIEATKRRAAKLQKQAEEVGTEEVGTPAHRRPQTTSRPRGLLSGSVRSTLRDPAAARAAFIYGEVLGTPTSMKKAPTVPGLSRTSP